MGFTVKEEDDRVVVFDGPQIICKVRILQPMPPAGTYTEYKICRNLWFPDLETTDLHGWDMLDIPETTFLNSKLEADKLEQQRVLSKITREQSFSYDDAINAVLVDPIVRRGKVVISPTSEQYFEKTFEQLMEEFNTIRTTWEQSTHYETLESAVKELKRKSLVEITNIVVLGTGSINKVCIGSPEMSKRYIKVMAKQMVAAITLRELLGDTEPLPCVVQDPVHSELDKQVYRSLGLTTVNYPDDLKKINSGSLVMFLFTHLSMAWEIGQGIWPAAMICNNWGDPEVVSRNPENLPETYARYVRCMYEQYERQDFQTIGYESNPKAAGKIHLFLLKRKLSEAV